MFIISVRRNMGISHVKQFHSLNPETSISPSISNMNITKILNSTVFDFDVVFIIGVTKNTGISVIYIYHSLYDNNIT